MSGIISITNLILTLTIFGIVNFSVPTHAYTLTTGDTVSVQIMNRTDLNVSQPISPDGTISLPLLGRTTANGRTLAQFQHYLDRAFANYIKSPQVVLTVTPRPIYVVEKDSAGNVLGVRPAQNPTEALAYLGGTYPQPIRYGDILTMTKTQKPIIVIRHLLATDTWETKTVSTIEEAKVLAGPDYAGTIQFGDVVTANIGTKPIYVVWHDRAKNTWDVKTAKTVAEARAYAGRDFKGDIQPGDTVTVEVGKTPDFFEENWYRVVSAVSVITGVWLSLGK